MRSPRFIPILGLAAAGSVLLAGCSGSPATDPNAAVATAADIADCVPSESTIDVTFGQQATDAMAVAVASMEEQYPGLTINAAPQSTTSYDDLTKTIVADIAVGKRPDVIMTGLGQLRFWVDTYEPTPLDVKALPATYKTQFLDAGTVDGTVYLAPGQISTPVLLVNQDMLDDADAGDAADITTFDDLVDVAGQVTDSTGTPSVSIPTQGLPDWFSQAFVQGSGETFVNEDGSAGFGTEKAIDALSVWTTLAENGLEAGVGDQDALSQFVGGKTALFVTTTSLIASVQSGIGSTFDWTPVDLPSVGGEGGPMPAGGNGWIVLSDDGCQAAYSNALISALLSPEAVAGASGTAYSYIPVDTEAGDALLASDAATPQLQYAWSYDKPLTPWGGFDGTKIGPVNDAMRLMAQKLQTGSDASPTIGEAVDSIDQLVGTGK